MDALIQILIDYGYWGMFITALLAGSFIPWSSEAVMVGLYAAGLEPMGLLISGTVGNVAGSMFNYYIGRLGKPEWIHKYLHVSDESLERAMRFMAGKGAWAGFFAFLPILGSAITIALGLMRANVWITMLSITIGKILRYAVLIYGIDTFFG